MPPAPAAASKQALALAEEDAAITVRLLTQVAATVKGKQPLFKAVAQRCGGDTLGGSLWWWAACSR